MKYLIRNFIVVFCIGVLFYMALPKEVCSWWETKWQKVWTQSDNAGEVFELGRGTTDSNITYIKLYNADGEVCYIYGNATQDGITVQGTKP